MDDGIHRANLPFSRILACFSCRIMETPKQKFLAAFLVTLVPCTARTVVILGLVAAFVNIWWAMALYVFDIVLIIILGRIAFKVVPGESVGLIMEIPSYHMPSAKVVLKQTWARTKSLLWVVFPAYIVGSAVLQAVYAAGWLYPVNDALSPITVGWLGLPSAVGILLIFGLVRKELTILMLAVIFQTTNFASVMSPAQLIVLALVSMIYVPCLAVISSDAAFPRLCGPRGTIHPARGQGTHVGERMKGGRTLVQSKAGKFASLGNSGGRIVVLGSCGERAGWLMRSGSLYVRGDSGDYLGLLMSGGKIKVTGKAARRAGWRKKGGSIMAASYGPGAGLGMVYYINRLDDLISLVVDVTGRAYCGESFISLK